jgi:hypothetical protein
LRSETLALAIEALSWMELKRMNGRSALRSTAEQLRIREGSTLRHAFRLIMEVTRRRNALDHIITMALGEDGIEDLFLGKKNFLRIFASEVVYGDSSYQELVEMEDLAREILGTRPIRSWWRWRTSPGRFWGREGSAPSRRLWS